MFERLKKLICDMAKFLTRLGAGLVLSVLPISNKKSHFVRYARRFGFRADHTNASLGQRSEAVAVSKEHGLLSVRINRC